jgi:hypothetical protein
VRPTATPQHVLDNSTLLAELKHNFNIADMNVSSIHATMSVDAVTLAKNFGIGIEAAKRTRLVTTQRGVRKMIHPSLNKRYKTNDRQLRYLRLPVTLFTDTMYSTILSRQGNTAAQVFCDGAGWGRAFPMKNEKEAHKALSLLFHRDGMPNMMVMDGAKAQVQGGFRRKLCDAGCHIRQTEPHTKSDKLLPLPQPPVRARTDARTNPSAQRATQLRRVLARVYAVSIQNQITTTVP